MGDRTRSNEREGPSRRRTLWRKRAESARAHAEVARARHASIDLGWSVVERDSSIGGALLAEALAYRVFVLLLPSALLLVSGIGLYAATADKSTTQIAKEAGFHGLIAAQIAQTASSRGRWVVFVLMIPVAIYALRKLFRALAVVHALAWNRSGRASTRTSWGVVVLGAALLVDVATVEALGWIRRHDQLGGLSALLVYLVIVGGTWLVVSLQLPRGDVGWPGLVPGSLLVGLGLLFINVFNVYVTTRLIQNRADTYGALGIAAALLFSLVLVGRTIVVGAELNASIDHRRTIRHRPSDEG